MIFRSVIHRYYILPRAHNISKEREYLTAYTCFKRTASSTESTPSDVNWISAPITKRYYILLSNARVIMYSIIIDINADRLYQTRQCLQTKCNVHERKEKATTRSTGIRSVVTLLEAKNCEPVYLPPLDYLRNCKPTVPRAFNSRRKLSLTAIGHFGALPHSG